MVEAGTSGEQKRMASYLEALGDVKAMHLLGATVSEGQTPFNDLKTALKQLAHPGFPEEDWWQSFDSLRDGGLIELKDIQHEVVVVPTDKGREAIRIRNWRLNNPGLF